MSAISIKKEIIKNIGSSYAAYRTKLALKIIKQNVPLKTLYPILYLDHPVSTRFSWLLGDIGALDPARSKEIVLEVFKNLEHIRILNFDRTIARQCMLLGDDLPKKIEGEIVDRLFYWLNTHGISVATKYYSMIALFHLCKKYPDIKNELQASLEAQAPLNTESFKKHANRLLVKLKAGNK
jgi:hypothetical protein